MRVAAWTADGAMPVVIQTYPLIKETKDSAATRRPFPTLYWLCHAEISRAVAELERRGVGGEIMAEQLLLRRIGIVTTRYSNGSGGRVTSGTPPRAGRR